MTSVTHDLLVKLIRRRLELVPFLLAAVGHPVPGAPVKLADSQLSVGTLGRSATRRWRLRLADVVVHCGAGEEQRVVVCEVQTSKPSDRQRRRQHTYLAVSADVNECGSILMVLTVASDVARACGEVYLPGHPKLELIPVVLGPGNTPLPDASGTGGFEAELAVLAALNGKLDMSDPVGYDSVVNTILEYGRWRGEYLELLMDAAVPSVHKQLEELMNGSYYSTAFMEEARVAGIAKGKVEGKAEDLLSVLEARNIPVPAAIEREIRSCTDVGQLDRWIALAARADIVADVFPVQKSRAIRTTAA